MAGGTIHHCPKQKDSGKNCRRTSVHGSNHCVTHQTLCQAHNKYRIKGRECHICIRERLEREKRERRRQKEDKEKRKEEQRLKAAREAESKARKPRYKKN
ncbi:hypothetical protein F5Y05DRAFT_409591 [Hypoxylon sp. FL0543]|nr:hypothetical protein F5Y05DRAFT_409591 [Hypoxylon sp. FL0543]